MNKKILSLFLSYVVIFVPATLISFITLRYYSLEFIYNEIDHMFSGSFVTGLLMTIILSGVVVAIAYFLAAPFDKAVKRISTTGEELSDDEKRKCLSCYKSLIRMTIIIVVLLYVVGQFFITVIGIKNGRHPYRLQTIVLVLLQASSFGYLIAAIIINGLDLRLINYRKLLKIHTLEPFKKQMNLSIAGSEILVFTAVFFFIGMNMLTVPYGYLHGVEANGINEMITVVVFKKGLKCIFLSMAVCAVPVSITVSGLNNRIRETNANINQIALQGDLQKRIDVTMLDDFGNLTTGINKLIDKLSSMIISLKDSSGELQEKATDIFDCTSVAFDAIKNMSASFNEINSNCDAQNDIIEKTHQRIKVLTENTENILSHVREQTEAVENISSSIEEMTANIASVAQTSKKAEEVSVELMDNSKAGNEALIMAVKTMNEIQQASEEVQTIVQVIKGISSQTNLLAMNAAIEAAHAGSFGVGFAVVAEEVKNLAESSGKSASEIQVKIKDMSEIIEAGVKAMNLAENSFDSISVKVDENAKLVRTISDAMEQQSAGARETMNSTAEIVEAVKAVEKLSKEEADGVNNVASDMEQVIDASGKTESAVKTGRYHADNLNNAIQSVDSAANSNKESVGIILKEVGQFQI